MTSIIVLIMGIILIHILFRNNIYYTSQRNYVVVIIILSYGLVYWLGNTDYLNNV